MATSQTFENHKQITETLERKAAQLAALSRVGRHLSSFLTQQELLQQAVKSMREDFGYLQAAVMLIDEKTDNLYIIAATDNFLEIIPEGCHHILEEGAAGTAAQTGETVLVKDTAASSYPRQAGKWLPRSSVSSPIKIDGNVIGILEVESDETETFNNNDTLIIEAMANQIAVSIKNARLYEQALQEVAKCKQIEEKLRESETNYRAIVEQSHDAIYIYKGNKFLFVNDRVCKLVGYNKEELLTINIWDLIHPEDRAKIKYFGVQRAEGKVAPSAYTAKVLRKDGKIRICDFAINTIQYRGNYAVLGIVRDITERKEIEKQLQQQERLAAIGQLAGGIAHDFRNYLTTIILHTQIAQRDPNVTPGIAYSLKTVVDESKQASNLIQQILDFSRHTVVELSPIDLGKLIQRATSMLSQAIPENIQFTLELTPTGCTVEADFTRMQQVLINLATNARDAMPNGGKLHIKLSKIVVTPDGKHPIPEMPPGEWAELLIIDTGTGMTANVQEHLFEPFFTTKETGHGTGLGLAQVYGIIKHHKGFIDAKTAVGEGCTFRIYLPICETETEINGTQKGQAEISQGKGESILLVEDDTNLREAGRTVLNSLGYRVSTASDGQEALKIYRDQSIDLVITDLIMPKMSGQELRNMLMRTGPVKIIAITGHIMQTSKEKLKKNGFLEIIEKPFNVNELAKIVRQALDQN